MNSQDLLKLALDALHDLKAVNVKVLDVADRTTITDHMVIASGTSDRHVKAMADAVDIAAREAGHPALGKEGLREGEWALVDLGGVIVHLMQPRARDFYNLEKLWSMPAEGGSLAEPKR